MMRTSSEDLVDRVATTLRSIQGEDADAGAAAASRRVLYTCAVNGKWDRVALHVSRRAGDRRWRGDG